MNVFKLYRSSEHRIGSVIGKDTVTTESARLTRIFIDNWALTATTQLHSSTVNTVTGA